MWDIIVFLSLLALGYTVGAIAERRHYKSIEEREERFLSLPLTNFKTLPSNDEPVKGSKLVMGSAVISVDYFKRILAGLRNIFGGEMGAYSTLVDRARREAVLRMLENSKGSDIVINLRIETSVIGASANRRKAVGSIEAFAYGTAVQYQKQA